MFAAYLGAQALPIFLPRPARPLRWLTPAALLLAAYFGPQPWVPILGLAAGFGSSSAGRPPAWVAGLQGGAGWTGVLGAVAGFVALSVSGTSSVFVIAAALAGVAALDRESHEVRQPPAGPLRLASVSMVMMMGIRVIEPALVSDRLSAAVFGVAWAAGIHVSWHRAPSADARATLALPFVSAAALAGLSVVEGPGMIFLWALVALAVGGVLGASSREGGRPPWPWILPLVFGAILAWRFGLQSLDSVLWTGGSIALIGGFGSLLVSGRVREAPARPDLAVASQDLSPAVPPQAIPARPIEAEDEERAAALMLLEALRQARKIRSAALAELKAAGETPFERARRQARSVLADLQKDAGRAMEQLSRATT